MIFALQIHVFFVLFQGMLNKYDGTKPMLIGIPYPVVYEVPMEHHVEPPIQHPVGLPYDFNLLNGPETQYNYNYNPSYENVGIQPNFKSVGSSPTSQAVPASSGTAVQASNDEMIQYNTADDPFDTYQK